MMEQKSLHTRDGLNLRYYSIGSGPRCLVLLNPPGMSLRFWRFLLARLSPEYRVLSLEYRGFPALTALPAEQLSFAHCLDDVGEILQAEGVERADFLTWCGGTSLAMALHERKPHLLRSLCAVGMGIGDSNEPSQFVATMREVKQQVDEAPGDLARLCSRMQRVGLVREPGYFEEIRRAAGDPHGHDARAYGVADVDYALFGTPVGLCNYLQLFQSFIDNDRPVREIGVPMLLLRSGSGAPRTVGNLREVSISHVSPFVMLECPDAVVDELSRFHARVLEAPAVSPGTIEGLPRIDRYFPECWCATIEAVARHRFGIADFGKLYGRHSFRYTRPPGPIGFRADGVQLDLEIYREEVPRSELPDLMTDLYGLRTEIRAFTTLGEYWDYCSAQLREDRPIISDFDLRFIAARREYDKVDNPHVIAVFGYDAARRELQVAEQMLGTTSVSWTDLQRCFAHKVATQGGLRVWHLEQTGTAARELTRAEALARIECNVSNLSSPDPMLGLNGLRGFRDDLAEYLAGDTFHGRPFSVPGLWVFSHERHIVPKWLRSLKHLFTEPTGALEELEASLAQLFTRWLHTDYLLEKCLAADNGKPLKNLPAYLSEIIAGEERALQCWQALYSALARSS